jgi:serine/threonine protein kinase
MNGEDEGDSTAPAVPLEPLRALDPKSLGGWRMLGRLGTGGMGVAFLAERDGLWAVVKMIRSDLSDDRSHRARISRELDAMRLAEGPHTASLYESDLDGDPAWFAMEFIPGLTLTRRIDEVGRFSGEDLQAFSIKLAEVLEAVHSVGIVHRDLKPSNVMLSPDGPKLIDFGIADLTEGTQLTRTGAVLGSTGWLAPEQVTGDAVSSATDVHAWGLCVLYAATGEPPFGGDSASASLYRVLEFTPDVPDSVGSPLRGLVRDALSKDPTRRPKLDRICSVLAPPPPPPTPEPTTKSAPDLPELDKADVSGASDTFATIRATDRKPEPPKDLARTRRFRRLALVALIPGAATGVVALGWLLMSSPGDRQSPQERSDPTVATTTPVEIVSRDDAEKSLQDSDDVQASPTANTSLPFAYGVKVSYEDDLVEEFVVEDSLTWSVDLCSTDLELLEPDVADEIRLAERIDGEWEMQEIKVSVTPGERCGNDGVHIVIPRSEPAPLDSAQGKGWSECSRYRLTIPETSNFAKTQARLCVRTRVDAS